MSKNVADIMGEVAERLELQHQQSFDNTMTSLITNMTGIQLLQAAGFRLSDDNEWDIRYPTLSNLTPEQLVKIRRVLNTELVQHDLQPYGNDARKRLVKVILKPKAYPDMRFSYVRKTKAGQKCRVKRVVSSQLAVVCDS
jgi:hypothetical protein